MQPVSRADIDRLKESVDLVALIGQDTDLKPKSSAATEHSGPCPWCAGVDRFVVWPERGRWWCRQCTRQGDAIAYVRLRKRFDFGQACDFLVRFSGVAVGPTPERIAPRRLADQIAPFATQRAVSRTLAYRPALAEAIVARAESALTPETGAFAWLRKRGLTHDTMQKHRLGWSAGFTLEGLRVHRGVVLPWILNSSITAINVRQPAGAEPKYMAVAGSRRSLYLGAPLRGRAAAILVEGEFDAILLGQEVGDFLGIASLGGAGDRLRPSALPHLLEVPRVFVAYDGDSAGRTGAARIAAQSDRFELLELPSGDFTDLHKRGVDLGDYLCDALAITRFSPSGAPVFGPGRRGA